VQAEALVMEFSAPAPGKSQGTRERGSFLEKKLPHTKNSSQSSSAVTLVAAPPAESKKPRWDANVCLGCDHVTTPPHRRVNCPHKNVQGWMARGGPPSPLPGVALLARLFRDVCLLDGVVEGVAVKVGLDSMSSNSLISSELVRRLGSRARVVQRHHVDILLQEVRSWFVLTRV
jgi:hypothetical protein